MIGYQKTLGWFYNTLRLLQRKKGYFIIVK